MSGVLAAGLLVFAAAPVIGQTKTGSTGGGLGSSGSSGGLGSSGSSGGLGSSGSSGGLGTSTTGGTTRGGTSGTQTYGTDSPFGPYYGNPLAVGFPVGTGASTSASLASQYQKAYPTQLSFGQVISNGATAPTTGTATLNRSSTAGTATVVTSTFPGASSSGIRRAPQYISEPVFDRPERPSGAALQADLQQIVARSGRLASRGNIQVSVDGTKVVLRGNVTNERERASPRLSSVSLPACRTWRTCWCRKSVNSAGTPTK